MPKIHFDSSNSKERVPTKLSSMNLLSEANFTKNKSQMHSEGFCLVSPPANHRVTNSNVLKSPKPILDSADLDFNSIKSKYQESNQSKPKLSFKKFKEQLPEDIESIV